MVLLGNLSIRAFNTVVFLHCCLMAFGKDIQGFHGNEMNESDRARICHNFSVGNPEKMEFYSPLYPNNYPNNTECVRQITAPFGYFVQIDFRDNFHLEDSPTCEYDSLEVRDGPYGYSKVIRKVCGDKFPNFITSSDRYLWLKFSSDDSIEYSGFRAVYQFIRIEGFERPPSEECIFHREGLNGILSNNDIQEATYNYSLIWKVPLDCTWIIRVPTGWKMYLSFKKYSLEEPNNCNVNYIEVYGETLNEEKKLARFCGTGTEAQRSDKSILHVRYYAEHTALQGIFSILFTAFREAEECDSDVEFNCADGTCITKNLKCDGNYNCKYRYDEDPSLCSPATSKSSIMLLTSDHMIIILIVFCALVFAMCTSIVVTCYARVKSRRQRRREYKIRRSKDVSFDMEIDHSTEAALAAQAAEISAARRKIALDTEEETNGCYVPEVDLSVFRCNPNGHPISKGEDERTKHVTINTISDSNHHHHYFYCQKHGGDTVSCSSLSPPLPPPPPPPQLRGRGLDPERGCDDEQCPHKRARSNTFRTYLAAPSGAEEEGEDNQESFRAEAVVETDQGLCNFEPPTSAPDVIVHS
ncbi:neuropilin and tolloid-like protein 2 isoform X2 [Centruroides sculpturatus]|uniref:neuropilin and tolloid-like protein 2 isoform X1 n=1 Tax=Centruroides sculpturatus TaxID=218467 RepID=UPI000C6DE3FA|nr:neuropilin and tolloid-like protein 2 isoform X1 [Centruroides sculpturatus]XP_023215091.1 neuropilin and tolloid-like protein 2 isoform X2 [Centruroides sculpturatus]